MKKWLFRGLLVVIGLVVVSTIYSFIAPSRYSNSTTYSTAGRGSAGADGSFTLDEVSNELTTPSAGDSYENAGFLDTLTRRNTSPSNLNVTERKVKTSGALSLLVEDADVTAGEVAKVASEQSGVVLEKNIRQNSRGIKSGWVVVSVPQSNFTATIATLKSLAVEVESEVIEMEDITEEYVDTEAQLKNLRAEEQSYQRLLEQSSSIEQTIRITKQLTEVRTRIESIERQLQQMNNKVTFSNIAVDLTAEQQAQVLGVRWRPLVNAKLATQDMLESLSKTTDILVRFVIFLPVMLIWGLVFFVVGYVGAKVFFWVQNKNNAMREQSKNATSKN